MLAKAPIERGGVNTRITFPNNRQLKEASCKTSGSFNYLLELFSLLFPTFMEMGLVFDIVVWHLTFLLGPGEFPLWSFDRIVKIFMVPQCMYGITNTIGN